MRSQLIAALLLVQACTGQATGQGERPLSQAGVIEGFYGPPWSHQDRIDVLRFMGDVGLTTYYYAPKDDPYHRQRWREPYPADRQSELAQLADTARAHGVRLVYAISPGGTMVYADSGEYQALRRKLDAVAALGVTDFALFLDDVPPTLQHAADRATYPTLGDAHADLINRLHQDLLTQGASLAVTPTTYTDAWGDREYLRRLGERTTREVPFFWTGVDVAAPEITAAQARTWGSLIGRAPLVWDNYPVNDFARWRPFLGPLRHRAPDLGSEVVGILANPMNEAHASMIALATLAAYARDPQEYDPDRALSRALVDLYGPGAPALLAPFIEIWGDYADDENLLEPLFVPGAPIEVAAVEQALARLEAGLARLDSAAAELAALRALHDDLAPFVRRSAARFAELASDPAYVQREGRLAFRSELERYEASPAGRPTEIDGVLDDWGNAAWHRLRAARGSAIPVPRAAFRHDAGHLQLALRVPVPPSRVREGAGVGEGDHVALVLQSDTTHRRHLAPDDLLLLVAPPTATQPAAIYLHSLPAHGFMAKYLADNPPDRTFSEFLLSTFGAPPEGWAAAAARGVRSGVRKTADGYQVELAVPLDGRERVRLSLTVASSAEGQRAVHALARRSYPANPATFSEVVVRR